MPDGQAFVTLTTVPLLPVTGPGSQRGQPLPGSMRTRQDTQALPELTGVDFQQTHWPATIWHNGQSEVSISIFPAALGSRTLRKQYHNLSLIPLEVINNPFL